MKILLTGATGYIGSAVLTALLDRSHEVLAPVRSAGSLEAVTRAGAQGVIGDVTDVAWLSGQLAQVDGAIHAAAPGDGAAEFDGRIVDAVLASFAGTAKPYVHTGGIWSWGAGAELRDDNAPNPPALTAWRPAVEARVLESGLTASVLSPGVVYGHDRGLAGLVAPDADGRARLIGDGSQHWTTVHVDDLAELYARVLEAGRPLGRLLGVSGVNPTVREIAEAYAPAEIVTETADETRARLGEAFADALLLDQQAVGDTARELGWAPTHPSLVEELRAR
ncbi:NAD-dependent epimerase/dehydratase family protein [Protaetiibacter sp. SSC-01]|uniref:NAD-dependent epimerase/dehydratase family protein n=1 Tax=Protaetiibacter sp. SSC-01 TaxID=2759943 RepID=UPI001656F823|nr:NAD-dependent epimerase/dehydratase family protein [Protaetiibacter sp. SSC-01]QNO37510.1 NAD-dependent epimerase/dehydratase family protein [Protaetiibacter sp. SSC-01]